MNSRHHETTNSQRGRAKRETMPGAFVVVGLAMRMVAAVVVSVAVLVVLAWLIGGCASTPSTIASSSGDDVPSSDAPGADDPSLAEAEVSATPTPGATTEPTVEPTAQAEPSPTAESAAESTNGGGDGDADEASGEDAAAAVSDPAEPVAFETVGEDFAGAVQPILEHKCASCHSAGGPGAEALLLETAGDASAAAEDIAGAVGYGYMPPWPASAQSVPFRYDRSLSDEQIAIIVGWGESGGQLDVPTDTPIEVAVEPLELDDPDSEFRIDPYESQSAVADDYRCFVIVPPESEQRWITGFDMVPDQTENVHHAIVYRVDGNQLGAAEGLDGADGQPGWSCYGQTGLGREALLLGWAPGQDALEADPGAAFAVKADSFLVMQVHYHFDGPAPVDQSSLKVNWGDPDADYRPFAVSAYVGPVEIPCGEGEDGPLCDRDAAMAAAVERYGAQGVRNEFINFACGVQPGDFASMTTGEVTSSCTLPAYGFGEIVSILGHEHELGSSFRLTLNKGDDQTVLLDIPDWDFDWQYQYRPADQILIEPGDSITIDCGWDRKRRDSSIEPQYVLWADGTSDEMCFATIVTVAPGD